LRRSKTPSVVKAGELLTKHIAGLEGGPSIEKVKQVAEYLFMLGESLGAEQASLAAEVANLTEKIQHIKNIIFAQQTYTRRVSFKESMNLCEILDDLLAMHEPAIVKHSVHVVRDFAPLPTVTAEKSKLIQVLDNLIKNALEAMEGGTGQELRIQTQCEGEQAIVSVTDTGHGIGEDQLKSIFRFGFTTKQNGHGFGLHSSAIAMGEMGGTIRVLSGGVGQGATFTISLPLVNETTADNSEPPSQQPAVLAAVS
jgi:C4-dicarboxylate-specific signal transduction histidine kinase